MNKALMLPLVLFSILLSPDGWTTTITLKDAYLAAMENTENIKIAKSQLQESEANYQKIRGNFLPNLSIVGAHQRQNIPIGSNPDLQATTAKVSLSQSLLAGGKDKADLNAAEFTRSSQEFNVGASRNSLYADVANIFYTVIAAGKEIENIQKSIELTKQRISELKKRTKIGRSRNTEVLAASAQKAILEAQLLDAVGQQKIARDNLINITGFERNVQLSNDLQLPQEMPSLQTLVSKVENRPDILAMKASERSLESSVSSAKSGYFPSLDLTGNYYFSQYLPQSGQDWDATLTLKIPIFEGGITQATVRVAEERKRQVSLLEIQKKRQAENEIRANYNVFVSSTAQIKSLEKALIETEQNLKEQERDYRHNLTTNLEVLQAQNAYFDTKRSFDRVTVQALNAYAALKASTNQIGM